MQVTASCGKLIVRDGRVICPYCGKGTVHRLLPTTVGKNILGYCKRCHQEIVIDIAPEPVSHDQRLGLD